MPKPRSGKVCEKVRKRWPLGSFPGTTFSTKIAQKLHKKSTKDQCLKSIEKWCQKVRKLTPKCIKNPWFLDVIRERPFCWKCVFPAGKQRFLRLRRIKQVAKTLENYVRNGCLRNVLKIDGFLTKTDLQNVPKTMPKLRFLGYNVAPDFWHVFEACFGSKMVPTWVQNGAQNDPRNR